MAARFPHRVIAAALRRQDRAESEQAATRGSDYDEALQHSVPPNEAFQKATRKVRRDPAAQKAYVEYDQVEDVPLNGWELSLLRDALRTAPELVLAAAKVSGREAAVRTYGTAGARILDLHAEFKAAGFSWPSASGSDGLARR